MVHHVAFASRGFNGMKQRLSPKGLPFDVREVPGVEVWQIFVTDPNGVMIELNYEMAKEPANGNCRDNPSSNPPDAVSFWAGSLYVSGPEMTGYREIRIERDAAAGS